MAPQRLPCRIDRHALAHGRLDLLFDERQENIGAAGRPVVGAAVHGRTRTRHWRRVVIGARRGVEAQVRGVADGNDHRWRAFPLQRQQLVRSQRCKSRVTVEHIQHRKTTGWRRAPGHRQLHAVTARAVGGIELPLLEAVSGGRGRRRLGHGWPDRLRQVRLRHRRRRCQASHGKRGGHQARLD